MAGIMSNGCLGAGMAYSPWICVFSQYSTIAWSTSPTCSWWTSCRRCYCRRCRILLVADHKASRSPRSQAHMLEQSSTVSFHGLSSKRTTSAKICANWRTTEMGIGSPWHSAKPGLPFPGFICGSWYSYRREIDGKQRPPRACFRNTLPKTVAVVVDLKCLLPERSILLSLNVSDESVQVAHTR